MRSVSDFHTPSLSFLLYSVLPYFKKIREKWPLMGIAPYPRGRLEISAGGFQSSDWWKNALWARARDAWCFEIKGTVTLSKRCPSFSSFELYCPFLPTEKLSLWSSTLELHFILHINKEYFAQFWYTVLWKRKLSHKTVLFGTLLWTANHFEKNHFS